MRPSSHALVATIGLTVAGGRLPAQGVDTIRAGHAALRAAALRTGTYTMDNLRRTDGVDTRISTTSQSVTRSREGETDVFVIRTRHMPADGDTTVGTIVVRAADFALVHQRVTADHDSAAVSATHGHLTGWVVLPGEPVLLLDQALDRPVLPVEGQIPWLFPLLPLADGYAAAIPHYSPWAGGEEWSTIRVTGTARVLVGGRAVDCWVVDGGELFPGYAVTYWIDKESRRVVQGVARGTGPGPEFRSRVRQP